MGNPNDNKINGSNYSGGFEYDSLEERERAEEEVINEAYKIMNDNRGGYSSEAYQEAIDQLEEEIGDYDDEEINDFVSNLDYLYQDLLFRMNE